MVLQCRYGYAATSIVFLSRCRGFILFSGLEEKMVGDRSMLLSFSMGHIWTQPTIMYSCVEDLLLPRLSGFTHPRLSTYVGSFHTCSWLASSNDSKLVMNRVATNLHNVGALFYFHYLCGIWSWSRTVHWLPSVGFIDAVATSSADKQIWKEKASHNINFEFILS